MGFRRICYWPDTHTPLHSPKAVQTAIEIAKDFRPHNFCLLGDYFDVGCLSFHERNVWAEFQFLKDELAEGQELLDKIVRTVKPKEVTYCGGNHELRLERFLRCYCSKLGGLFDVRDMLGIPKKWRFLPYGPDNHHREGKLIATHGSLCGKYPAEKMVSKYGCSVVFGHTHKIQEFQRVDYEGNCHRGINIGWLGDQKKAAEYLKSGIADWSHGLGLCYVHTNGNFFFQTVHIIDGQAMVGGKLYG